MITDHHVATARATLASYYRHGITQNAVDEAADARALLERLRALDDELATTPGDDRGRELAEIADALDRASRYAAQERDRDLYTGQALALTHVIGTLGASRDALRALAAPAETEAGDEIAFAALPETLRDVAWRVSNEEDERALLDGARLLAARLAATPPAPEGEAGGEGGS